MATTTNQGPPAGDLYPNQFYPMDYFPMVGLALTTSHFVFLSDDF